LVLTQEYKSLIEKMVTSNRRFQGNEDLFEDFCSEALEKCLFILEKSPDLSQVQNYLNKIISTSMIGVLKSAGRITRNSNGYQNIAKYSVPLENPLDDGFLDIQDVSADFVERITENETLKEIYKNVIKIDREYPDEQYGQIFYMKYVENKKQREIASYLGISQGEISKRLFDLMKKINNELV